MLANRARLEPKATGRSIARQRASEATSKHAISAQASHGDTQIWRKRRATLGENNTRRLPDELVRMHRSHREIKGFLHFRFAWLLVDLNWADMGQNLHAFVFPETLLYAVEPTGEPNDCSCASVTRRVPSSGVRVRAGKILQRKNSAGVSGRRLTS